MIDHFLIRHGHAGARGGEHDDQRPLTGRGHRQAADIARALAEADITRVVSSPFRRCVETVEPLATATGLTVELVDGLAEGAGPGWILDTLDSAPTPLACCSHGDVLGAALTALERRGVALTDDRLQKGGIWVLTVHDGRVRTARYRPAP